MDGKQDLIKLGRYEMISTDTYTVRYGFSNDNIAYFRASDLVTAVYNKNNDKMMGN